MVANFKLSRERVLRLIHDSNAIVKNVTDELMADLDRGVGLTPGEEWAIACRYGDADANYGCMSEQEKARLRRDLETGMNKMREYVGRRIIPGS